MTGKVQSVWEATGTLFDVNNLVLKDKSETVDYAGLPMNGFDK